MDCCLSALARRRKLRKVRCSVNGDSIMEVLKAVYSVECLKIDM
jgi:hypothetical protein